MMEGIWDQMVMILIWDGGSNIGGGGNGRDVRESRDTGTRKQGMGKQNISSL